MWNSKNVTMRHEDEKTDIHSKSNQNCVYDAHFWMAGYSKVGGRVTMRNSLPTVRVSVHPKTNFIVNLLWKSNPSLSLYPYTSKRETSNIQEIWEHSSFFTRNISEANRARKKIFWLTTKIRLGIISSKPQQPTNHGSTPHTSNRQTVTPTILRDKSQNPRYFGSNLAFPQSAIAWSETRNELTFLRTYTSHTPA